ncbi:MAG: transposase [Steroidobacteraceae bacterium]
MTSPNSPETRVITERCGSGAGIIRTARDGRAGGHVFHPIDHDVRRSRTEREAAGSLFEAEYRAKCPTAVESLFANWERPVIFFDFPAEHWKRLRTINLIESPFGTVRLRERATRGARFRSWEAA